MVKGKEGRNEKRHNKWQPWKNGPKQKAERGDKKKVIISIKETSGLVNNKEIYLKIYLKPDMDIDIINET